jgi:hypothetical protein
MLAPLPVAHDFLLPFLFEIVKSQIEHHGAARLQHAPFAVRVVSASLESPHNPTPN